MSVQRFGVSFEKEVLEALDEYVSDNHFSNRSQALRHLVNLHVVEKKWQCNNVVAGALTLHYDPGKNDILSQIGQVERSYPDEVLSSQRFIFDPSHCMQVLSLKGTSSRLTELSEKLIPIKGIQHGKLLMSRVD